MIDTKIACQCGNRFKFGMDLVNGRAPDGLVCPTCGTPATPACNALVDFLSGKEPAPTDGGPRPVKEVKVTCACGARYKFDIELAENEMPSPVQCPGCQIDLTPLANEEIRNYRTKQAIELTVGSVPAPIQTAVTAASPQPAGAPTASTLPVAPPITTTESAVPAPAQTPSAPTSAPTPEAGLTPTNPPAAPPAATATPGVVPISDPFGPAPTNKIPGSNLRPLEAPKPNRPPPGSRPAAGPPKPAGSAAPASAPKSASSAPKSDPKSSPKPIAKPAAASREPSLALGAVGAVAGAAIGAGIWFAVLKSTSLSGGFIAPVLGILAGFGARLLGRGASPTLGGAACISATLAIVLMGWLVMVEQVNRQMQPQLKTIYDSKLAEAKLAAAAKTDEEMKAIVARNTMSVDVSGSRVTEAELKTFRTTVLPKMLDLASGKISRSEFESKQLAQWRGGQDWMEIWQDSLGIFGLLWMLAGVGAAARIALR